MGDKKPVIIQMKPFPNDEWTRVELFLRAYGRLPSEMTDVITQETLDLFCRNREEGKIKGNYVEQIYRAIQSGEVELDILQNETEVNK